MTAGRGARARTLKMAIPGVLVALESEKVSKDPDARSGRGYALWFPARLGPPRKRDRTIAGHRVKVKVRGLELPPGPNGSRGNPYEHARWSKEWRAEAKRQAESGGLPRMDRVRISAVFRRRALNVADEDNDRARCKPLLDGLRDAGVIAKDTRKYVEWGTCTEQRAGADGPGLLLIVEEIV